MRGLDAYLTTEPQDDWTPYFEAITEAMDEEFFNEHENWLMVHGGKFEELVYKCGDREYTPALAAKIIQRLFNLYKIQD